jgi:hypothetical protein
MSGSEWDIIAEEPSHEPEEHRIHSATAIGAAAHAKDAADVAEKAAEQAEKTAKRAIEFLKRVDEALEQAVHEMRQGMQDIVETNTSVLKAVAEGLHDLADAMRETHGEHAKHMSTMIKVLSSPRRVTRDGSGRVDGLEPMQ